METAITLFVFSTALLVSLGLALLVEKSLLLGFFHVIYAPEPHRLHPR